MPAALHAVLAVVLGAQFAPVDRYTTPWTIVYAGDKAACHLFDEPGNHKKGKKTWPPPKAGTPPSINREGSRILRAPGAPAETAHRL